MNELMDLTGFNNITADKQLLFVLQQNSDFKAKLFAIREYNKLRQRVKDPEDKPTQVNITLVNYGDNKHHTAIQVHSETISDTITEGVGQRFQEVSQRLAS